MVSRRGCVLRERVSKEERVVPVLKGKHPKTASGKSFEFSSSYLISSNTGTGASRLPGTSGTENNFIVKLYLVWLQCHTPLIPALGGRGR